MNPKPRILLIPNVSWWILGEMGKRIMERFSHKYDFYFVPETILARRPDLLDTLVGSVHAVHCLDDASIELFRNYDRDSLPPIATWIHHVTTWSPYHQLAIDRSSALTVCTRAWKNYLAQHASTQIEITVVPHGVDNHFFQRRNVRRQRFGIPPDRFVVGLVGSKGSDRDNGRKGIDIFLGVARQAAASLPNIHFLLGGPGWEEELAQLTAAGVSASATGWIRRSDLPFLYSALDVYLLTSRVEGGPCTVFEAMSCGTPVVATRVGAVPELIIDGVNGYSADVDDIDTLLTAIITLAQSPEHRIAIANNGHDAITSRSWGHVLAPLEDVYEDMIRKRAHKGFPCAGPRWMKHPAHLLHASCAADAVANVLPRIRKGTLGIFGAFGTLTELLDNRPIFDIPRGIAMLREVTFRAPANTIPSASQQHNIAIEPSTMESHRDCTRTSEPTAL